MRWTKVFWYGVLVGVAVGVIVLGLSAYQDVNRAENERTASTTLKKLTSAQADFRANDRDWNQVNDFWTGDVAGLYYTRPNTSPPGPEIQLIERAIAEADAAPLKPLVPQPVPYHGYLFRALEEDDERDVPAGDRPYKKDTGGTPPMGKVHNTSKFAYIAYPAEYPKNGKYSFVVNENNTVFRFEGDGSEMRNWVDPAHPTMKTPNGAPTRVTVVKDALHDLQKTTVTAHLTERHEAGKNLLWCATMQLCWDELEKTLGFPLDLQDNPATAVGLNRKLVGKGIADPEKCLILAGKSNSKVLDEIRSEMKRRFPGAELPDLQWQLDDNAMAYAFLQVNLPFEVPMFRHKKGLSFRGEQVMAFGLWDAHTQKPTPEQLKEVTVCEFVSEKDFVVQLHSKTPGERILVARVTPGATLFDTVQSVMRRSFKQHDGLTDGDDLIVPCVNFDVTRIYEEIQNRPFLKSPNEYIRRAEQRTQFRLDELGARLESVAVAWNVLNGDPPKSRKMICDGPFLILLARQGAQLPYFAYWVENSELLVR